MSPKKPQVAIILFNTLARTSRFAGNIELSLLSGQLEEEDIKNEIYVLLMRPGDEEKNRSTIDEFIAIASENRFKHIIMHAPWLEWLPDTLRKETGASVFCLDGSDQRDLPSGLKNFDAHNAIIAAIKGAKTLGRAKKIVKQRDRRDFNPRFDYTFLGTDHPPAQEIAFVSIQSCPYRKYIRSNPLFKGISFPSGTSTYGCSYCAGARSYAPLTEKSKQQMLAQQAAYLQNKLDTLQEIAVPFPEDYFDALTRVILHAEELGLRPVTFSGQLRAGAIVDNEEKLSRLLAAAGEHGFRFIISVVGLESFRDEDLQYFNRDGAREVREAVNVIHRLRRSFDPRTFMPQTVGSFILFHPWQTMEGLKQNVEEMLSTKIAGLFATLNFNDVRMNPGVPLYTLAEADGLLASRTKDKVQDVPLGGYFEEHPWVFGDENVGLAHRLFSALSARSSERIGLLKCILNFLEGRDARGVDVRSIIEGMDGLCVLLQSGDPWRNDEASPLLVGENCNQACETCLLDNAAFTDDPERALEPAGAGDAFDGKVVTISGREPTMLRWLGGLIGKIKDRAASRVHVLTNGRMLAYPGYAEALALTGAARFLVKLHSHRGAVHDRVARVEGAFDQTMKGVRLLRGSASGAGVSFVFVVGEHNRAELEAMIDFAAREKIDEIRFALPAGALNLARLEETTAQLASALKYARSRRIAAGTDQNLSFNWIPPQYV